MSSEAVVAGHICFDLIPQFKPGPGPSGDLFKPGALVEVGPAVTSLGGAVANTGLALHRLGVRTELLARVGDDFLGRAVLEILRGYGEHLGDGIRICPGASTSYSAILSPPDTDRMILHCPGANDAFGAEDVPVARLAGRRLFHFGYPTLLKRFLTPEGEELQEILARARAGGLVTSLDMTRPDPNSRAGQLDWDRYLTRILPLVDVFLPSVEELLFMLERPFFDKQLTAGKSIGSSIDPSLLSHLGDQLLEMGTPIVVIKLGNRGLYLRTASKIGRDTIARGVCGPWRNRELIAPAFQVLARGTTGAGDCAIAGFLTALLRDLPPSDCLNSAAAAGAASVERPDAVSGLPTWNALRKRIAEGWPRRPFELRQNDWNWDAALEIWTGPRDA